MKNIRDFEDRFRKIFPESMSTGKYEGSYMLNVPYEEAVHHFVSSMTELLESLRMKKVETKLIEIGFDGVTGKTEMTEEGFGTMSEEFKKRGFNEAVDINNSRIDSML